MPTTDSNGLRLHYEVSGSSGRADARACELAGLKPAHVGQGAACI